MCWKYGEPVLEVKSGRYEIKVFQNNTQDIWNSSEVVKDIKTKFVWPHSAIFNPALAQHIFHTSGKEEEVLKNYGMVFAIEENGETAGTRKARNGVIQSLDDHSRQTFKNGDSFIVLHD